MTHPYDWTNDMENYEMISNDDRLSDIKDHLGFLYFLVYQIPKNPMVLDLGASRGEATKALLQAVAERNGNLTSVDIEDCLEIRAWAKKYREYWSFYKMNDLEIPHKEYDMIFLDTVHDYKHTKKELEKFTPMVKKGGYFVLHDTNNILYMKDINRAVIEYFKDKKGFTFFNFYHNNGLLVIKVE